MNNPWLGLSSYTEESIKDHQFNGRSKAIVSLASMIRHNLFVTLYGRSGIGKTSLLQAGLFPLLRREVFSPLAIRLNELKDGIRASEIIWNKILKSIESEGYVYTFCDENDEYKPDFSDILVLRKLFSAGKFRSDEGEETIPVIVIDQFEEVLYKTPITSRLLILQLYALIDDNYNLEISHPNWHDDTNFRVVVSIREDDLFLFEDFIDSLNCIDFKSNRYRLLPLSDNEAKEIVLNPILGKNIFESDKEDSIAEEIVKLSRNKGANINTLLLSLICYVLYNDSIISRNRIIKKSDLQSYTDIINSYYKEVTKNLPKEQRYYIEDHLIDDQGRRTSIYTSDLEKFAPQAKQLIENSNHRLLNENQGRVEFIHDQLAASVMKIRSTRKSRRTKRIGIIALVILLLGVFIYSFSYPAHLSHFKSYKNLHNLIGDINSESINIKLDSQNTSYTIDDCPSLKSINIDGSNGAVYIYNCQSLVNISYPKFFFGDVYAWNCPNLDKHDKNLHAYETPQYMPSPSPLINNRGVFFSYDSINNSFIINCIPRCISNGNKYKIATCLSDSVKRKTDCYVLYGQKDNYSRLVEYQSFKSIKELPIYYTWRLNIIGMLGFLKTETMWQFLIIIGLLFIQCLFWIIAFSDYKYRYKSKLLVVYSSFIYGIGMAILATLSFMAFYWTLYNRVCLGNQTISWIMGVIGCLSCLFLVYKNSFYSLYRYIKIYGIRGLLKDLKYDIMNTLKNIKLSYKKVVNNVINIPYIIRKNIKLTISVLFLILLMGIGISYYFNEKNKRDYYIARVKNIIKNGEYARAYAIINELENQKTSVLYPSFGKELLSAKNIISGDSIFITRRITPQYVKDLVNKNGDIHNFSDFSGLLAVSNDATKFVVCVKYPKSNDLQEDSYQAILLDINNQSADILTPKITSIYNFKSTFSPSGKSVITAIDQKRYLYTTKNNSSIEISDKFYGKVCDVIMGNDSVYYFTSWGTLYKAFVDNNIEPIAINKSEEIWDNLTMISENTIGSTGNWSEIIIYNVLEDSVYFHSKQRHIGELRNINHEYAITTKGLFSIENDSLIKENRYLFDYMGNVIELQLNNGKYSFVDLNGKGLVTIKTENGERLNNIRFSKDANSIVNYDAKEISLYSMIPISGRNWNLSDIDRKAFNLHVK